MEELINLLHTGGYSCTIANKGEIRTFTQRGVVGKGAAALMILGGIKELYTDIISTKALELLQKSDIKVGFTEKGPFIWNRNHTGGCPVETMCSEVESAEEILPLIRDFLEKIRNKK